MTQAAASPLALERDWIVPGWPAPANVRAFVTTRSGGVSQGPWGSDSKGGLNLGTATGDEIEAVRVNHERLRARLPSPPRWLRQVHGADLVELVDLVGLVERHGVAATADAAFTMAPQTVVAVQIADCLPVLLTDTRGRAVAAAHSGWRGLAAGVIQNTVSALRAKLSDSSADVLAWLGPAIGPMHFEVGEEVLTAMRARLPDAARAFEPVSGGKYRADLFALARQALQQSGVARIYGGGLCTFSDPRRFYSFRRDRITGRHAALIWRSE